MPRHLRVPRLYYYSLEATFRLIVDARPEPLAGLSKELPFDRFPSHIVTDLMEMTFIRRLQYGEENKKILFTPTVRKAILNWSASDFELALARCPNLTEIIVGVHTYDETVRRNVKLLFSSHKINRIVFVNCRRASSLKHSELGKLPTIYNHIFQENNIFLMRKQPILDESVLYTTEFYFESSILDFIPIQQILKTYPQVRVLRHPSLMEALYHLSKYHQNKVRFKLKNLDMQIQLFVYFNVAEVVKVCVEMCPEVSVVDLSLGNKVALRELAEPLVSLDKLEVLCLRDLMESSTDLLQSILDKHGSSLLQLQTIIPDGLDVMNIFNVCPNLQSLELSDQRFSTYSVPDLSREIFPNLVELSLIGRRNSNAPSPLSKLLLSRSLVIVKLTYIKIEESVLDAVAQSGYWPNLRHFEAFKSGNLKCQHVMSLLESPNDLASLSIFDCDGVSASDIFAITKCIADLKLNVYHNSLGRI